MSKIIAKLANQPNDELSFDHNGQIKELLLELGLETCFTQSPPKSPSGHTVQMLQHLFHPTHFILFSLHLGYDDPKENGYSAICLPKTKYSPDQFDKLAKKFASRITTGDILEVGIKWSRKPGHSAN